MKHFLISLSVSILIIGLIIPSCSLKSPVDNEEMGASQDAHIDYLKKAAIAKSTMDEQGGGGGCPHYVNSLVSSPKNNQDVPSPVRLKWTRCTPPNCEYWLRYYIRVETLNSTLVTYFSEGSQEILQRQISLSTGQYKWKVIGLYRPYGDPGEYGTWSPYGYFEVVPVLEVSNIIGPYIDDNPTYYVNVSGGKGTYSYVWKVKNSIGQTVGTYYTETLTYNQWQGASGNYTIHVWVTSGSQTKYKSRGIIILR